MFPFPSVRDSGELYLGAGQLAKVGLLNLHFLDWPRRLKMALLAVASLLSLAVAAIADIREARQRLLPGIGALLAGGDQLVGEFDTPAASLARSPR